MIKSFITLLTTCFISFFSYAMDDHDGHSERGYSPAQVVLNNDVLVVILNKLPITELSASFVNTQWYQCVRIAFPEFYQFLDEFRKLKASLKPDSLSEEQALENIRSLRTLFSAIPATKDNKALLAEVFESKISIPVMLFRPHKKSTNYSSSLKRLVKGNFLTLVMMRLHREQGYQEEQLDHEKQVKQGTGEYFIENFEVDPLLNLVAPDYQLGTLARKKAKNPNNLYLKALCDRGAYETIATACYVAYHKGDREPEEISSILIERCQKNIIPLIKALSTPEIIVPSILVNMSADLFNKNEYTISALCYETALAKDPDWSASTYVLGGNIHLQCNNLTKAAAWYKKAIEKDIEKISLQKLMAAAFTFNMTQDYESAILCYKEAITRDIQSLPPSTLADAAFAFHNNQDFANAILCYEKALEKQPHGWHAGFYFNAGDLYLKYNNPEKATAWYKMAMTTNIQGIQATSIVGAAWIFFHTFNFDLAIQCCQYLLSQDNVSNDLFYITGYSYARMGNVQAAAAHFQQFIDNLIMSQQPIPIADYQLIKDVFIRSGAEQKYLDWVSHAIRQVLPHGS